MIRFRAQFAVVFAAIWLGLVPAQEPAFRSVSDLVIVPAAVTDPSGRFVRGLTASDFTTFEDGKGL